MSVVVATMAKQMLAPKGPEASVRHDLVGLTSRRVGVPSVKGCLSAAVVVLLPGVFVLYPLWQLLRKAVIARDGSFTFAHVLAVFTSRSVLYEPLLNSLEIAITVTLIAMTLGLVCAVFVAFADLPGKRVLSTLLIVPYILPSYALSMAWVLLFTRNGIVEFYAGTTGGIAPYGFWPIVVVQSVHLFPFAVIMLTNALTTQPAELYEAARIHGAGRLVTGARVALPMLLPALVNSALIIFAYAMSEFAPAMVLGAPAGIFVLTTQIWSYATVFPANLHVAAVLSTAVILLSLTTLAGGRMLIGGRRVTAVTGKGQRPLLIELGAWRWAAFGGFGVFLALALVLPVAGLLLAATVDTWGQGYGAANFTIRHFQAAFETTSDLGRSVLNVLQLGVLSAIITALLGLWIGYLVARSGGSKAHLLDALTSLPFILPGVVIGMALILAFARPPLPLYGTIWILLVAYVVHYLPISIKASSAAVMQLDAELEEAARVFGAGRTRVVTRILFPLLRGALFGGGLLVFVSVMKEVSAASIVWSPGAEVAPVMVLIQFADGFFSAAVATTFVLVMIVLLGTALAVRCGAVQFVQLPTAGRR